MREVDDEVVIVTVTGSGVTEVARHKRGEPYGYVISDKHKDPSHPSGPLVRHPIPTNETEGKFLGITTEAGTWLERAASLGTKKIPDTMGLMVKASSQSACAAIVESLAIGDFSYTTMKALLAKAQQVTPAPKAREVESLGCDTKELAFGLVRRDWVSNERTTWVCRVLVLVRDHVPIGFTSLVTSDLGDSAPRDRDSSTK